MRQHALFGLLIMLMTCTACDSNTSEIGTNFFNEGVLDFSIADSASVKLSTIQLDNIATNGLTRYLTGSHKDEKLGRITASPYFQLGANAAASLKGKSVAYDYLALVLPYDKYVYYDTTSSMTLRAFRVTEEMKLNSDNVLYNSDTFSHEAVAVGSVTFLPKPHRTDTIVIKLSDTWGQELFAKATAGSSQLTNASDFLKYLRGMVVIPDTTTSTAIIGLKNSPQLRLYYKDKSTTPVTSKYISFNQSSLGFTNIDVKRSGTKLPSKLDSKTRVNASITDHESYMESGAGLMLRVDMPYLRNLKQLTNFYPTQALLDIYIVRKSYNEQTPLPPTLTVYIADKKNNFYGEYASDATLKLDTDLGRDTHYVLDVTAFVKEQMDLPTLNENALVFTLPENFSISADRVYAAEKSNGYKTGLRIYYVTVNN